MTCRVCFTILDPVLTGMGLEVHPVCEYDNQPVVHKPNPRRITIPVVRR